MKLDTREKERFKNAIISISPNSYASLYLLNSFFIYLFIYFYKKFRNLDCFSLINWDFSLILFSNVLIINSLFFSCVKLIYVFLKAKAQHNHGH